MISNIALEMNLSHLQIASKERVQALLKKYITAIQPSLLNASVRYATENSGKYLRPLLIYATGLMLNAPWENMDLPAAAVELIHTYSLIHDDLPCMDNADLRRGKPTCHKVYSEGMAVLTGDALHTLALQLLSDHSAKLSPLHRLAMISVLTKACGPYGMAAGQALDITLMKEATISKEALEAIYHLKTGKLFTACVELGRLSANFDNETHKAQLTQFGDDLGLAFQIQDDILDIECTTETLGKPQGRDEKNNKFTYPLLFGLEEAKLRVKTLYERALQQLEAFGNNANLLRELTTSMVIRNK